MDTTLADAGVHTFAGDLAPLIIPSPSSPKKVFKFVVRHTLGPWTPSFWTSVWIAIKQGDVDLYLYGSDAVAYRTAMQIKDQADRDITKLKGTSPPRGNRLECRSTEKSYDAEPATNLGRALARPAARIP